MAKPDEKIQAHKLRLTGKSIADIAHQLEVSKSTVSYWCRDIALSPQQIAVLTKKSKRKGVESFLRLAEAKREARVKRTEDAMMRGSRRVGKLTQRDQFFVGLGLYWGEGYKSGSQEFGFTNSDPTMIIFYMTWLKSTFDVMSEDLILRVSINHAHTRRITEVEQYWSRLTKVPHTQFTKPSLIKTNSKKVYASPQKHFGTLRIKVRGGTEYRREVLGAIKALGR